MSESKDLMNTTNALEWAQEFVAIHGGDTDLMLSWFAAAIMTGHDHAARESEARVAELEAQQDAINQILDNASDGNCWPDEWPMEVVCIVEAIADAIDDEPTQEDQQ